MLHSLVNIQKGGITVTRNQIDYLKHLETVRSNKANESETKRSNVANENIKIEYNTQSLAETKRHNIAGEAAEGFRNRETQRHNVAGEKLEAGKVSETNRHNLFTEGISAATLDETIRSNQARESETMRSNQAKEYENFRHNTSMEQVEVGRLNENIRHNQATENLESTKIQETQRHNMMSEGLEQQRIDELVRSNQASEAIRWDSNAVAREQVAASLYATETNKAIREMEIASNVVLRSNELMEQNRHNVAQETETRAHNSIMENIAKTEARAKTTTAEAADRTSKAKVAQTWISGITSTISAAQNAIGLAGAIFK